MNKKIKLSIISGSIILVAIILIGIFVFGNQGISLEDAIQIELADSRTTIDGKQITTNRNEPVYMSNDIVYYEENKPFTYGAGTNEDAHTKNKALIHCVLHITEPGVYALSGTLLYGQVAVDLGEEAKNDKNAVVTLILNDANINCTVAPAIIFNNVYECGNTLKAKSSVNTKKAGANILIADGTRNNIRGSYVAKIYESYKLNDEKTEVIEYETLHDYDGAIYSDMSMNIGGLKEGTGVLDIVGDKKGISTKLHLTVNGGIFNISSKNDSISAQKEGVSVVTINGGELNARVNPVANDGNGIESSGWIVINGGEVILNSHPTTDDTSLKADNEILLNGGTVWTIGNKPYNISKSKQSYIIFEFDSLQKAGVIYQLKDQDNKVIIDYTPINDFSYLLITSENLENGNYTLWRGMSQIKGILIEEMQEIGDITSDFEIKDGMNYYKVAL